MNYNVNSETMLDLGRGSRFNCFTSTDHRIVREALAMKLTDRENEIVRLRFWEKKSVTEIASILGLCSRDVERHLTSAFAKLKNACMDDPEFSRSHKENVAGSSIKAAA